MKYDTVAFTNIGPIEKGQINRNKINVFFGPNNSGKSIACRLIYGIGQLNTCSTRINKLVEKTIDSQKGLNDFYGHSILNGAGFVPKDLLTHHKKSGNLVINANKKSPKIDLVFKKSTLRTHTREYILSRRYAQLSQISKDSAYIPAGRTGITQFFTSIIKFKSRLFQNLLDFYTSEDHSNVKKTYAKEIKDFTRSFRMSRHMEQFHDLILDAHKGMNKDAQNLFSKIFSGSIEVVNSGGFSEIVYKDPTGFPTEIESAGSGTVSSFPIVAGVYYVKKGGTLIIEEPEVHLEPAKQLGLLEELVQISKIKKIDLIFTTHSDYVLKKLLALVSRGKIKHSDLGLYYFNRSPNSLTQIEKIPVDKTGEAEQILFDDALNTLVEEFSE